MTRADIPLVAFGALPINLRHDDSAEGGLGRTSVTSVTGTDCADRVDWFEQADRMTITMAAAPDRQISGADLKRDHQTGVSTDRMSREA